MPEVSCTLSESPSRQGLDCATCTLPTGEVVSVKHRVPLYTLARELDTRGYGDWRLQAYTPKGTPSLRGLVRVMAGLTVTERDRTGLRLEKYRPFELRGQPVQRDPVVAPIPTPWPVMAIPSTVAA